MRLFSRWSFLDESRKPNRTEVETADAQNKSPSRSECRRAILKAVATVDHNKTAATAYKCALFCSFIISFCTSEKVRFSDSDRVSVLAVITRIGCGESQMRENKKNAKSEKKVSSAFCNYRV